MPVKAVGWNTAPSRSSRWTSGVGVLWHHRTKIGLTLLLAAVGVPLYLFTPGMTGDREFIQLCVMITGAIFMTAIILGDVARCPYCNDDLGYFRGVGPLRRANIPLSLRKVKCRKCGAVMDW